MRILCGMMALALAASVACAGRSETAATTTVGTGGSTTTPTTAVGTNGGGQEAERLTVADLENRMQEISTRNQAMRKQLMGGMTADAGKEAQQLATLFGDVERFWAQRTRNDAVKWSQDARMFATEAAGAAAANDGMKALQAANNMLGSCKMCHGTYREPDPAGGFRIRADLKIQ